MGFGGGRWNGGNFNYNTAVMRVNTTVIRNTYVDRTVINNVNVNRVSYNGGQGGINVRPNQAQIAAEHQKRFGPANTQVQQQHLASQDKANFASVNHGTPAHAALAKPAASVADFNHAVPAHGAKPVNANETRPVATARPVAATHPDCDHAPGERKQAGSTARDKACNHTANCRISPSGSKTRATKPNPLPHPGRQLRPGLRASLHRSSMRRNRRSNPVRRPGPAPQERPAQTAAKPAAQHESAPKQSAEKPHPGQK